MSNNELTDAEYDALMNETAQQPANPEVPDAEQDDIEETQSRPIASRYPAMRKLVEMQRELTKTVLERGTEPKDKASCARAWKELEVLRRIILGKHVTVEPAKAKAKLNASPMLTLEPTQDQQAA